MTDYGEGPRSVDAHIGQAIYTWSQTLPPRPAGYRFVAVSPEWESRLPWLEASTRSVIGFVGNDHPVSAKDRQFYLPIGRHVHAGKALAYRKQDAGLDGNNRPGNYVIHFMLASAWLLSLTDVLTMPDQWWIDAALARLKPTLRLPDIALTDFRNTLQPHSDTGIVGASRVVDAVRELVRRRSVSINGWTRGDMLTLLATMPPWVDYATKLVPEWSAAGPSQRLELTDIPPLERRIGDRRWVLLGDELEGLRKRLSNARNVWEIGQLFSG